MATSGLTEIEFWASSLRYLYNLADGISRDGQIRFEAARLTGAIMVAQNLKKGKTLKLTDVWRFEWEESSKANLEITPEMMEKIRLFDQKNEQPFYKKKKADNGS